MKICKGVSASPGLVLGQVSRLERHVETFSTGPFDPERELRQLEDAVRTAQSELDSMAERAASTEQAILQFQSMMLDDEGMMNEVRFCIKAGISAAAAMDKVGQRYADQLANMKDNPYMQLRSVDILDATSRVINILGNRPRMWLALDHPVILAADRRYHRYLAGPDRPGELLVVKRPKVLGRSAAAADDHDIDLVGVIERAVIFIGVEYGPPDTVGRALALDECRNEHDTDGAGAPRQHVVNIMIGRPGRARDDSDLARKKGKRAFERRVEKAVAFEICLDLFERGPQCSLARRLERLDLKLQFAPLRIKRDLAADADGDTVLRLKAYAVVRALPADTSDLRRAVVEVEIPVARRGSRKVDDLAFDPNIGKLPLQGSAQFGIEFGDRQRTPLLFVKKCL